MTKAQQMLAMAGLPDTAEGRAAFHKIFPTPEDFFKLFGLATPDGPIKPDNVILKHYPGSQVSSSSDDSTETYKSGGSIHIKPSHKGRFTEYKKRTGKTTAEALHSKDPHVRQMANFARNAAKWKHEDGGFINKYNFGANVTDCPQGYVKDKKGNCIPVATNVSNLPFKSNVQSVTNMEQSNTNPLKFQSSSKIIDYYDNGMPNDTNYMYYSPNQSAFISTQKDPITGKPMSQFTSKDKMYTNMSQDSLNMYKSRIEKQLKNQGGFAQGGMIKYADGGVTGGGEDEEIPKGYKKGKRGYYEPIEGATTQFEGAKDYYRGWFNSPIYKQIIQKQADAVYGDNEEKKTKFIDRTINANINNWKNFTGNPYLRENLNKDYHIFGESGTEGLNHSRATLDAGFVRNNPSLANSLYTHELTHLQGMEPYATPYDRTHVEELTPAFNPAVHKGAGIYDENGVWQDMSHVASPEDMHFVYTEPDEVRTEIHAVRQLAKQAGIYDPYTEPFTKEHLDKIEKLFIEGGPDGINFNQLGRLRKHFPDENVIDMMNTISQNKTKSEDNIQMAALGSFVGGPPEDEYSYLKGSMSAPYGRFPKKDPGFNNGPGTYWSYMDRLKNRNVNYANPHQGVKDAIINTNTITGSCESGTCYEFADGGTVDALQLMGMPTPPMYAYGSQVTDYTPSFDFGHIQSKNNTYMHGFGYGGPIGKYDFGSTIKDIGAGAYGVGEGFLDTITMGATDQLTDAGYKGLQKLGGSSESEIRQQDSIHGYGQTAGAVTGAIVNPSSLGTAISEGSQGLGQGISQGSPNSKSAQQWGQGIETVGGLAGMAVGAGAFGAPGGGAAGMAKTNSFKTSDLGKFAGKAGKVGQGFNAMSSGDPMQMMSTFGGMGGGSNMGSVGTSNFSPDPNKYMNQGIDFTSTAPSFNAMGGAVNAPNMMQYGQGGRTMLPPNVSTGRGIVNRYDDGGFLNKMGSAGMMGLGPALIAGKMADGGLLGLGGVNKFSGLMPFADGGLLGTMIPLAKPFMADGGMTPTTQINVEKGELLVDKNGKILTEYRGGGMVPHPADGSMDDRGTVPAQEGQFVITKKLAPNYKAAMKNNDKFYAEAMRNNISFDKQRKEAKEQEQQARAEQMMMAKFGGMVRGYGYGGGVMKFDGGGLYDPSKIVTPLQGQALPASISPSGYPTYVDPNGGDGYTYSNIPGKGWVTYKAGSNKAIPLYGNPKYQPTVDLLNTKYASTGPGNNPPFTPPDPAFESGTDAINPYKGGATDYSYDPNNPPLNPPTYNVGTATNSQGFDYSYRPGSEADPYSNKYKEPRWNENMPAPQQGGFGSQLGKLIEYSPALYNLGRGIFEKADKVNPEDYMVKNRIKPYEEQYRPDYRPYNAMIYGMNRNPNSDSLAGKVNLFNTAQNAYADERYKVNQGNLARRMQADQANASLDQFNANARWQGDIWNKQALAKKRDFIGKGFEQGSLAYQNERNAFLYANSLKDLTANYDYVNGRWVPKTTNR